MSLWLWENPLPLTKAPEKITLALRINTEMSNTIAETKRARLLAVKC